MGVVYHANYIIWFEIARTDFCVEHGFAYRDMEQEDKIYIVVAEVRCRYKAPAHYDEKIVIRTRLTEMRKRVLVFGYEIYRQGTDELLAEGESVHVVTDHEGRPRPLPDKYQNLLLASPAGKATGIEPPGRIDI